MPRSFIDLTERTKMLALTLLEAWSEGAHSNIVEAVLASACENTLPQLDDVEGVWVMQMMWQVPDLLETTAYADGMDVNATVRSAVEAKISDLLREELTEQAVALGLLQLPPRL
ncbi:hypothetical protein DevBK_07330 [Devosia sp. BK]|uniref:hypothetical protein n=1 Tax=Devosia sp. BK TaxID=2871706 RepID=UPI00293A5630|nr:hypothetical protein [Devosia sp. BK]MDV3251135.1 hypothetical protein [Devosia sp. BK]